ncbi:FAD-binding protein, partial [bacterium]|nr:FAD-binding protein [bacterium]
MIAITEHIPLSAHTTFKTGGSARFFCVAKSIDDVLEAIAFAREKSVPFFILGGGSNVLVSDEGFAGLVIKMEIGGIEFTKTGASVGAGENWDHFVEKCVEQGLCGAENLSFIPGTVGAAPVQNIGAYGAEVKDIIESVEVIDIM